MTRLITPTPHAATSHFDIHLGDLATWALFVGAFVAAVIALRQLRIQQDDNARQTRQLERQQANDVDFSWHRAAKVFIRANPPGSVTTAERTLVVVENNSRRPIRDVICRIELHTSNDTIKPLMLGAIGDAPSGTSFDFSLNNPRTGHRHPLMRPKAKYGFLFEYEIPEPDATSTEIRGDQPTVQFIDDADLTWRIDGDLRLQQVEPPRRRWIRFSRLRKSGAPLRCRTPTSGQQSSLAERFLQ